MATNDNRNLGRRLGLFGVVALFSGLFAGFFITGRFSDPWVWVQLVLGAGGLAAFFATNLATLSENFSGRGTVFLATSLVSAVVVAGALGAVNYIVVKKPKSWDLTKDQIFTLSDQTTSTLKGLSEEVTVLAFYAPSEPEFGELDARLRQYKEKSEKLKVQFLDPSKHLAEIKQYNVAQGGPRVIVKAGAKESRAKELSEESLTNAIAEVTRGAARKIWFSKGHGERALADASERGLKVFVDALKSEGYGVEEILLAEHKQLPAEVKTLVVAGPVASLQPGEVELVKKWVDEKGGKLVLLLDPQVVSGFELALGTWGIVLGNNLVIDADSQQPEVAIAQQYDKHPITDPKTSAFQLATLFPLARSVSKAVAPASWTVVELAKTGARAWGKVEAITGNEIRFDPAKDLKGPVPLAVAATKGTGDAEARVVVVGNSSFVANGFLRLSGNKDFALNAVSWASRDESKIAIRPKSRQSNQLFLSADQQHKISLFAFNLLPFSLLFAGLLVWQTRKSR